MSREPRRRDQRRRDTEHRLATDIDLWLASASPDERAERDLMRDGRWLV